MNKINNFLNWKGSFKKYFDKLGASELNYGRYHTMKIAIGLFLQRGGNYIVETGCQRQVDDWGGGCSTKLFAEIAADYDIKFTSIDINKENLDLAKYIIGDNPNVTFVESDSIKFFQRYEDFIDLLYLDSLDFPYGPLLEDYGGKEDLDQAIKRLREIPDEIILNTYGDIISECQEHCLNELKAVERNLHSNSIVLIDDNALPGGGKARLAKIYLAENGWECVLDGYQTLWIRRKEC